MESIQVSSSLNRIQCLGLFSVKVILILQSVALTLAAYTIQPQNIWIRISCVESAKVRKSIPLKVFTTLIELVINPLECLNKNCGTLFCTSCLDQQAKQTNEKQCKVCKSMGVPQSNSSLLSYHAYFDQPSQVILKILNKYQLTCNFCRKPFTIKDI